MKSSNDDNNNRDYDDLYRVSPGLFVRTTLTRTIKNNITIVHFFNLARYIYIPCARNFCGSLFFADWRFFVFCWTTLKFAIRTD